MKSPAETIRRAAQARWRFVYAALNISVPATPMKHGPCPVCGGRDRFRCDDQEGSGSWFCNQCEPHAGDGFALVQKARGCSFPEAVRLVADVLRIGHAPINEASNSQHNGREARPRISAGLPEGIPGKTLFLYADGKGDPVICVQRINHAGGGKHFVQWGPAETLGAWQASLDHAVRPRPLYCLPDLLKRTDEAVVIHEGEQCVHAHLEAGLPGVPTTTLGGAKNAKHSDFSPLAGRDVVICLDSDEDGERYGHDVTMLAHQAQAKSIRVLRLPGLSIKGDVKDWLEGGGTAEQFQTLLESPDSICPRPNPRSEGLDESNSACVFRPVDLGTLLEQPEETIPYIIDGYLAEGGLALLAGYPKVGKSTLGYDAVVKVATGQPWLGRIVRKGKVLTIALEEHTRDVVRRFWTKDEELAGQVKIVSGTLPFTEPVLEEIVAYINREQIRLVLVDTLHAWWGISDENSSAEVLHAGGLLLKAIRRTPAAWLCLVHTRKSGGEYGHEIRGSSALLGLVDVALTLKRTEGHETQRCLEAVSRYADTPAKLIIGLGQKGYEALGDPGEVSARGKADTVWSALTQEGQTIQDLQKVTGLSKQDVSRGLAFLADRVARTGAGHRGTPYRYARNSICPTSNARDWTLDESNPKCGNRFVQAPVPVDESNSSHEEVVDLAD